MTHLDIVKMNSNPEMLLDLIMNLQEQTNNTFNSDLEQQLTIETRDALLYYYVDAYGLPDLFLQMDKRYTKIIDDLL